MAADASEENPAGVYLVPFDKSAVREVTFGVSATDDFVKRTIGEMRESGLAPEYLQATRNAQAYALKRAPIDDA